MKASVILLLVSCCLTCSHCKRSSSIAVSSNIAVSSSNIAREYESFVQGIELFSSITITVNQDEDSVEENEIKDDDEDDLSDGSEDETTKTIPAKSSHHKLDACTIKVSPSLNPEYEYFRLPLNLMKHLGVHSKQSKDGLVIIGE